MATSCRLRLLSAMMLSGDDDRRYIMAIAVQQVYPIAHLPLVLGVLRRLEVATVIDRLIPPHPAHVLSCGVGSKPWSWPFWMAIMRSIRWGHGWKSGGWWRC